MRRRHLTSAVLMCVTAVSALTACGPGNASNSASGSAASASASPSPTALGDLTADQISLKAQKALLGASSLTMKVDLKQNGDSLKGTLSMDRSGHCSGTLSLGSQGGLQIIESGKSVWAKLDSAMLAKVGGSGAISMLKNKYVDLSSGTAASGMKDLTSMCDLHAFLKNFGGDQNPGDVTKAGTAVVDGVQTVVLKSPDSDGAMARIYVTATGTPYPLEMSSDSRTSGGTIFFSHYGEPVVVQTPPASEVFHLPKAAG